jgi:hypothetical protein
MADRLAVGNDFSTDGVTAPRLRAARAFGSLVAMMALEKATLSSKAVRAVARFRVATRSTAVNTVVTKAEADFRPASTLALAAATMLRG